MVTKNGGGGEKGEKNHTHAILCVGEISSEFPPNMELFRNNSKGFFLDVHQVAGAYVLNRPNG